MISLETIEAEILELEQRDTTYAVVERLAWLYTVKDHIQQVSAQSEVEAFSSGGDSEFLTAVNGAPCAAVLSIFDEHMNAIAALYPKEYEYIIRRILATKE